MSASTKISELGPGKALLFLRVLDVEPGRTQSGDPFLTLRLGDRSGSLSAKVWKDAPFFETAGGLLRGEPVKVLAHRGQFRGTPQLEIEKLRKLTEEDRGQWDSETVFGPGYERISDLLCRTLVMDIETAPLTDMRSLPKTLVQEVTRVAKDREWDTEKVLGLNPLFSRVVSIALGDAEREDGAVLFAPSTEDLESLSERAPDWMSVMTEAEMLESFWTLASLAETVVTYNGRSFDLPFLRTRSAILGVPVLKDLLSQPPYRHRPHLDLYLLIKGGGSAPMNLDAACYAFDIESPKEAMDGSMVGMAFRERRYEEIARYNLADVRATRSLFRRLERTILLHLD